MAVMAIKAVAGHDGHVVTWCHIYQWLAPQGGRQDQSQQDQLRAPLSQIDCTPCSKSSFTWCVYQRLNYKLSSKGLRVRTCKSSESAAVRRTIQLWLKVLSKPTALLQ